jgi:hypothetical protein
MKEQDGVRSQKASNARPILLSGSGARLGLDCYRCILMSVSHCNVAETDVRNKQLGVPEWMPRYLEKVIPK